jgi:phosphohistidine phosphatase
MRRLILMRHGKAEIAGLTGGDRERPLADRGRLDSMMSAQWLYAMGLVPDLAIYSPSLRTQATWDCAAKSFPKARGEVRDLLYQAEPETIQDLLDDLPAEADTVMVVGHTPGLQDLARALAEARGAPRAQLSRLTNGFPTAAVAAFRLRKDGAAVLEALFEPPSKIGAEPRWSYFNDLPGDIG